MKKNFLFLLALSLFSFSVNLAVAATRADAEAMVKKAIELFKTKGKDGALAAISDPKGEFIKGDLYAFVIKMDGTCIAHPANAKLINKDLHPLKDTDGKQFMLEMTNSVKAKPDGTWTTYNWTNPETKKIQKKSSYTVKVPGEEMYVGCGVYE
ncbi:MAG: cache domain-containing protein [Oligoflexia bacterium]|nr:cache domain-containing protein [Oligoflexia bacterium]